MSVSLPYIVPLQNAVGTDHGLPLVFPDAQSGDLDNSIEDGMPESEVREIIYRLLQGFEDFHGIRILYPDIKPENILTIRNSVHNVVLADFGFTVGFPEDCFGEEFIGSPFDCAPEIWKESEYTEKVDLWSLGRAVFARLAATFPFDWTERGQMRSDGMNG
jgi:serine/threonine protein kinase